MKILLHPKLYKKTPVYCNGNLVKIVSSTQQVINLEVWSGTHPFFTKSLKNVPISGKIERFFKKYNI